MSGKGVPAQLHPVAHGMSILSEPLIHIQAFGLRYDIGRGLHLGKAHGDAPHIAHPTEADGMRAVRQETASIEIDPHLRLGELCGHCLQGRCIAPLRPSFHGLLQISIPFGHGRAIIAAHQFVTFDGQIAAHGQVGITIDERIETLQIAVTAFAEQGGHDHLSLAVALRRIIIIQQLILFGGHAHHREHIVTENTAVGSFFQQRHKPVGLRLRQQSHLFHRPMSVGLGIGSAVSLRGEQSAEQRMVSRRQKRMFLLSHRCVALHLVDRRSH